MERTIRSENSMVTGVIWKQLLLFFFPIMLGSLFQQLYNTVDAIVVGKFVGTDALAAVGGSASNILNLLIGFFTGVSSGATVIISQYFGANDRDGVNRALHTAMLFALVGGAFIMVLGLVGTEFMLRLIDTPEDTIAGSALYLRIMFMGMVPTWSARPCTVTSARLMPTMISTMPMSFCSASKIGPCSSCSSMNAFTRSSLRHTPVVLPGRP